MRGSIKMCSHFKTYMEKYRTLDIHYSAGMSICTCNAIWLNSYETRCNSGCSIWTRANLAGTSPSLVIRSQCSYLALVNSECTRVYSNMASYYELLRVYLELLSSYCEYREYITSLAEFSTSYSELAKILNMFKNFGTAHDFKESCPELERAPPSHAELSRVIPSYMVSFTRVIASASFWQLALTRHSSPCQLAKV